MTTLYLLCESQSKSTDRSRIFTQQMQLIFCVLLCEHVLVVSLLLILVEHMLPLALILSWVCVVALLVRSVVYEKEMRLKEVRQP